MPAKKHWTQYARCVAGVIGGSALGVLTGESVGASAFLAVVGSLGWGIIGGVGGLLAGAAMSRHASLTRCCA